MNTLIRFFHRPLSSRRFDAIVPRWSSYVVGPALLIFVSATFPRQASDSRELFLGLSLGLLLCLLYLLFGNLLGWLQELLLKKPMPTHLRLGEYISYGSFPVVFGLGLQGLSTLSLTKPGFMIGILLLLSVTTAVLCLGILSSLMRIKRE